MMSSRIERSFGEEDLCTNKGGDLRMDCPEADEACNEWKIQAKFLSKYGLSLFRERRCYGRLFFH